MKRVSTKCWPRQLKAVYAVVSDKQLYTLAYIAKRVKAPTQSVSARLRDLRKKVYGGFRVNRVKITNRRYAYSIV